MPSVKKNESKSHYLKRCIPMLIKEGKEQKQAIAECINLFKQKWKAKGGKPLDETSAEFQEALANFDWDNCPECLEREAEANHKAGIFELDIPKKKF
jgi:hypothetical protein